MAEWACVQTKPQEEQKALNWIKATGHTAYLPMAREPWRPAVVRPLFNRYLFLQISERWWAVLSLPGVSGMLMTGQQPAVLRLTQRTRRGKLVITSGEEVIAHIKSQEGPDGIITLPRKANIINGEPFERGQVLRVRDHWHVLHGQDLRFAGMRSSQRVQVMLRWFGHEQIVDLDIRLVSSR